MASTPKTDIFDSIAADTMKQIWNRTPRSYQGPVISHLLQMMALNIHPDPVLLVQSTGSGKSTVPLTCSVVDGGISIIIENTLALGSDQSSKVKHLASTDVKNVKSFHLDMFKSNSDRDLLFKAIISHCTFNYESSIILFTSPEAILHPLSLGFIKNIVSLDMLNLFCIDEVHLFVEFGISFRHEFQLVKTKLLPLLQDDNRRFKIPVLLMTATLDATLFGLIQLLLGINIKQYNIFWGEPASFSKRNIKIEMKYSIQYFKHTTDDILSTCAGNDECKTIIIASTAKKSTEIQSKLDHWLDRNESIKGDSCLIIGDLETELKFGLTTAFTNTNFGPNGNSKISSTRLSP